MTTTTSQTATTQLIDVKGPTRYEAGERTAQGQWIEMATVGKLDAMASEGYEVDEAKTGEEALGHWLDDILRDRALLTLANLAARKNAEPTLVNRLLKYAEDFRLPSTVGVPSATRTSWAVSPRVRVTP